MTHFVSTDTIFGVRVKKLYGTGLDRHPKLSWKLFRAFKCGAMVETVWNESGDGKENESN